LYISAVDLISHLTIFDKQAVARLSRSSAQTYLLAIVKLIYSRQRIQVSVQL
jgi:hypothetical protein